jgi:nucleoside-diphosphate-sugar epimerase
MSLHVIVGAGPIGTATAKLLAEQGHDVRVVTRSGGGPEHPAVERVKADATDAARLTELAKGAAALYNCASPLYYNWFSDWPPLAASLLTAAENTGAVLTVANNLYGYGPVTGPITDATELTATHPKLKLRADMYRDALALHQAGRIRMTEVRSSDYIEANSIFSFALAKPLRAGKRAYCPTPLNVKHSWTSISDVAKTLATVAQDDRALGKAWMVPTNAPLTVQEVADRFMRANGLGETARVTSLPYAVLWTAGVFDKMTRELRHTAYQFNKPFVLDSSLTERTFGLAPIDLDVALRNVVEV